MESSPGPPKRKQHKIVKIKKLLAYLGFFFSNFIMMAFFKKKKKKGEKLNLSTHGRGLKNPNYSH
jgi:hypothetical protein